MGSSLLPLRDPALCRPSNIQKASRRQDLTVSLRLPQAVVPRMAHHDADVARECQNAVRLLLTTDAQGSVSREAVQLVADLVRVRKCHCPPEVVRVLLCLDLAQAAAAQTVHVRSGGCKHQWSMGEHQSAGDFWWGRRSDNGWVAQLVMH